MLRKIICLLLCVLISASAFAACGKQAAPQNNTVEDIVTAEDTADNAARNENVLGFKNDKSGSKTAASGREQNSNTDNVSKNAFSKGIRSHSSKKKNTDDVSSNIIAPDQSAAANGEKVIVSGSDIPMFSEAGGTGDVVKTLVQGEEVIVLEKTAGGFWKVQSADNTVGYANVEKLSRYTETETVVMYGTNDENQETYYGETGTVENRTEAGSSPVNSVVVESSQGSSKSTIRHETGSNTEFKTAFDNAKDSAGGNWAAAYIELNTGAQTAINDTQMQAASLIKLYIMGAIYENYDTYASQNGSLDDYLYSMITVSDNSAANTLVGILGSGNTDAGRNVVTSYCKSHGYNSTSMGRLLLESTINGDNYTSVGDCARFLTSVYNSELPHSSEMLNLLKQQTRTSKIPAGVPYGVQTANKTGELDLVQNDAAIVFADNPYVFCVMSENVGAGNGVSAIVQFSKDVYAMSNN